MTTVMNKMIHVRRRRNGAAAARYKAPPLRNHPHVSGVTTHQLYAICDPGQTKSKGAKKAMSRACNKAGYAGYRSFVAFCVPSGAVSGARYLKCDQRQTAAKPPSLQRSHLCVERTTVAIPMSVSATQPHQAQQIARNASTR
jgi:hypothetical protein